MWKHLRVRTVTVAFGVCVSLALMVTAGCSQTAICSGQCGSPFSMSVDFRGGTSKAQAELALSKCRGFSEVLGIEAPQRQQGGRLAAEVKTQDLGDTAKIQPLLACLHKSSFVSGAGWAD